MFPQKSNSKKIQDFETWLDSYLNFEKTPKKNIFWLKTIEFFCEKLKNPQSFAPCFHVAGSKGKGSISLFIASILSEAGFKTGLYTSPHILDFLERVTLCGKKFDEKIYEKAAAELENVVNSASQNELPGGRGITWFELVTIFAFLTFREAKVDYSVFEVGLGGRLDSTNVVSPLCECIGPIELEHTEFLGDTVEKIAAEKGGIIKQNSKVVVAKQVPSVRKVFEEIAAGKNAEIFFVEDEIKNLEYKIEKVDSHHPGETRHSEQREESHGETRHSEQREESHGGIRHSEQSEESHSGIRHSEQSEESHGETRHSEQREESHYDDTLPKMKIHFESRFFSRPINANLKMLGKVQAENAALASLAVKIALPKITEDEIEAGLSKAALSARFEVWANPKNFEAIPFLVIDGAHTVNSVKFTMETMEEAGLLDFEEKKPVLLFACAADKDVEDIAPLFYGKFDKIFLTKPGNTKASNPQKMENAFEKAQEDFDFDEDFSSQIKKAFSYANQTKKVLLVTGSFYLAAEVMRFRNEN